MDYGWIFGGNIKYFKEYLTNDYPPINMDYMKFTVKITVCSVVSPLSWKLVIIFSNSLLVLHIMKLFERMMLYLYYILAASPLASSGFAYSNLMVV